jgi:hypothetical protein
MTRIFKRIGNRRTDLLLFAMVGLLAGRGIGEAIFSDYGQRAQSVLSRQGLGHYEYIKHHLQTPFRGYANRQALIDAFKIITLSHMACGLVNVARLDPGRQEEILPLMEEIISRAQSRHVAPMPDMGRRPTAWPPQGLYVSHLNLILGCYRLVGGDDRHEVLHGDLTRYLSRASLKSADFHVSSFGQNEKFPADQSVTLLSLYVFDQVHGTGYSKEPIRRWLNYMKTRGQDAALSLPCSSLEKEWVQRRPRGCAMSWTCLYMAQFDPQEARALYDGYRARYFRRMAGVGGFREWPPKESYGMNSDTGPILFGLGFAASGLGIGPARLFGDTEAYSAIMRSGALVGWPIQWRGRRSYLFSPLLGEAILFNGETATPWFPA